MVAAAAEIRDGGFRRHTITLGASLGQRGCAPNAGNLRNGVIQWLARAGIVLP
jgi:hypothetical protein